MKDRVGGEFAGDQAQIFDQAREPVLDEVNPYELTG